MTSHAVVQAVIIGLLACNTVYYLVAGRASEALDSLAWYVLLLLFLLEAARAQRAKRERAAGTVTMLRGLRGLATLAIMASAVLYVMEKAWLDAGNLFLWIAVVALLEFEVRRPATLAAHHHAFAVMAALVYGALAMLVLVWLARGEWMDAWDAALWLAAFGLLELKLLRQDQKQKTI